MGEIAKLAEAVALDPATSRRGALGREPHRRTVRRDARPCAGRDLERPLSPMIQLLQELLWAYGPCGQEDAVREICLRATRSTRPSV